MTRRQALAAMVIGGLLLAGCGQDGQPPEALLGVSQKIDALQTLDHSSVQRILVVNHAPDLVSPAELSAYCENQNTQLARDFLPVWGGVLRLDQVQVSTTATAPDITVYLEEHIADEQHRSGYHLDATTAWVSINQSVSGWGSWEPVASHEVLETLANLYAPGLEICDAPADYGYRSLYYIGLQQFSDFETPAGAQLSEAGALPPWDFLGIMTAPSKSRNDYGFVISRRQ